MNAIVEETFDPAERFNANHLRLAEENVADLSALKERYRQAYKETCIHLKRAERNLAYWRRRKERKA